jgi:phospholipid/cholesterol/gamma-HCH transport system substrate-binding protein
LGSEDNWFSKTFTILAVFKNVEGLNAGDNVWLSGVKIGTVKEVKIVSEGRVIVSLALKERQNEFIKKDATAYVGSDGLVGSKIIVVRPGTSAITIHDNDTINAESPTDTQDLINLAKDSGTNIKSITDDLKLIVHKINTGEGLIGELVNDGEITHELRATISNLKMTSNNTAQVSKKMDVLVTEMEEGKGLLPHLLRDTLYTTQFESALNALALAGRNAKEMTDNLQKLTQQINDKDNLINVLIADSSAANKMKEVLRSATSASEKLDENMTAMRSNFLLRRYFKNKEKESGE